jgi:hypothetical protein
MFKAEYPVTIYSPSRIIRPDRSLEMSGALVEGTIIDVYLRRADGEGVFEIVADGEVLYSEPLANQNYNVGDEISRYYHYAQSDKQIQVALPANVDTLEIRYTGREVEWSGIDVTLPAEYSVQRWWYPSGADANAQGVDQSRPYLIDTSTITISPGWDEGGRQIRIYPDVTYTADAIYDLVNKETILRWAKAYTNDVPHSLVRFEDACFDLGTTVESAGAYYSDILASFKAYDVGWYSNDYLNLTSGGPRYANAKPVPYNGMMLEVETLKVLQKWQ